VPWPSLNREGCDNLIKNCWLYVMSLTSSATLGALVSDKRRYLLFCL
jgi:hypothetical protein